MKYVNPAPAAMAEIIHGEINRANVLRPGGASGGRSHRGEPGELTLENPAGSHEDSYTTPGSHMRYMKWRALAFLIFYPVPGAITKGYYYNYISN